MHPHMLVSMTNLSDPVFWVEVYVHFVFICSAASLVLAPFEEWAGENCEPATFKKIHAGIALVQKYGALNKRSNLNGVSLAALKGDTSQDTKSDSAAAGK